jgi:hypothetical protein
LNFSCFYREIAEQEATLLNKGVLSLLSYGEKYADLKLAYWKNKENLQINHKKIVDLQSAV